MRENRNKTGKPKTLRRIADYDAMETSGMIDRSKPLKFEDFGLKLPEIPATQVISIRLPSALLNNLRAISSETDIPYQALIKLFLADAVAKFKKKVRRVSRTASSVRNKLPGLFDGSRPAAGTCFTPLGPSRLVNCNWESVVFAAT